MQELQTSYQIGLVIGLVWFGPCLRAPKSLNGIVAGSNIQASPPQDSRVRLAKT